MCNCIRTLTLLVTVGAGTLAVAADQDPPAVLTGTQPLAWDDDIASRLVAGADRFLLAEIDGLSAADQRSGAEIPVPRPPTRLRSNRTAAD